MKNITTKVISPDFLNASNIDCLICASGYESRCTFFYSKYRLAIEQKFVLSFLSYEKNKHRKINDKFFLDSGFESIPIDGEATLPLQSVLNKIDNYFSAQESLTILIDYSSMTEIWYSFILFYYNNISSFQGRINLLFSYSYAIFSPAPKTSTFTKNIGPITGFCSLSIPNKPTALIIGLGYDKGMAFGLTEYLDAETFVLYTEAEGSNRAFSQEVENQNTDLLSLIKQENIFKYPIYNLDLSLNILYTLCSDLIVDHRIVLAPCGPKPFTLLSLIVSLKISNVDVWRISSDYPLPLSQRVANGKISIFECSFINRHS